VITPLHLMRGAASARWFVAVDGGGSGTRLRLYDPDWCLLGEGRAGPSALSLGGAVAWSALGEALAQAGLPDPDWSRIALGAGLAGALTRADSFLALQPGLALLALDHDGTTQVLGAHGGPGAVVAAGTGTVGFALRADGSRQMVSGWGWRCGDEGSGAWLGLRAVQLAQQALDGRAPRGPLAEAVLAQCGTERAAVLGWIAGADAAAFAALAPLVVASPDPAAAALLDEAARALDAVIAALDPDLPLSLSGSVGLRLRERLAARSRLCPAKGDAVDGARLLLQSALELSA
jgi:glucosamine kinase